MEEPALGGKCEIWMSWELERGGLPQSTPVDKRWQTQTSLKSHSTLQVAANKKRN